MKEGRKRIQIHSWNYILIRYIIMSTNPTIATVMDMDIIQEAEDKSVNTI
jgi:hypothetical protein